jgi:catechol 2,3-dioxygenase-like lactoylglutathione lyase family enzyme
MPVTGSLSHIDISVGYPERSIPFYDAFFRALGYRRWNVDQPEWQGPSATRATWGRFAGDGSRFDIEVRPGRAASRDRRYDRYEPGPHHVAFHAESTDAVDRVYEAVRAAGGEVLDAPAQYGGTVGYGDFYYAAFFADPDGFKLEVCYAPSANK